MDLEPNYLSVHWVRRSLQQLKNSFVIKKLIEFFKSLPLKGMTMFLLLLLLPLSIAQYDMNPGNFGVTKIYHEMRLMLI